MRLKRTTQMSLPVDHPLGRELESIPDWLDAHPELLDEVAADLGAQTERGRSGLTCESILRCAVPKHVRGETWRGLAFALEDSRSACRFAHVEPLAAPKKSALQAAVGAVSAETWERVNGLLLEAAREAGVETGKHVRVDSTVTETHILAKCQAFLHRLIHTQYINPKVQMPARMLIIMKTEEVRETTFHSWGPL